MTRLNQKKIMVIDDDASIVDMMKIMLELEGYDVTIATGGDLLKKISAMNPALLFLDIWLSGKSGIDICAELKKTKKLQHIPVVLVSASKNIQDSTKKAKADDYLEKPFEMDDLLAKVKKYISQL